MKPQKQGLARQLSLVKASLSLGTVLDLSKCSTADFAALQVSFNDTGVWEAAGLNTFTIPLTKQT